MFLKIYHIVFKCIACNIVLKLLKRLQDYITTVSVQLGFYSWSSNTMILLFCIWPKLFILFSLNHVMDQAPISQNKYMSKLTLIHYHLKIILSNVTKLLLINNCPTLLLNHCIWLCLTVFNFIWVPSIWSLTHLLHQTFTGHNNQLMFIIESIHDEITFSHMHICSG